MKVTRFVESADGGSCFEEVEIAVDGERRDAEGHLIRFSAPYVSPAVSVIELPPDLDQDWHQAPARQLVVVLEGRIEVTTTDGETRRWGPGEVFMPADVSGRGHRTRALGGAVRLLFAPFAEDA